MDFTDALKVGGGLFTIASSGAVMECDNGIQLNTIAGADTMRAANSVICLLDGEGFKIESDSIQYLQLGHDNPCATSAGLGLITQYERRHSSI